MTRIITLTLSPAIDASTSIKKLEAFSKLRCARPKLDPGGGGINVARVVHRLGGAVTAIYPEGGASGKLLRKLMDHEGVESLTEPTREETRQDFTVFEEAGERQFRFVLPGAALGASEIAACLALLTRFADDTRYLVVSGSMPPGASPDVLAHVAGIARSMGWRMILDTSGEPLRAALEAGVFMIKPNLREFRGLTGISGEDDSSLVSAARELIASGKVQVVALSMGSGGAMVVADGVLLKADGLPIKPISVVGAGDSFVGAMVWSLARGDDLAEALRYGVAAGSAALLHAGTELCRREDVMALAGEVRVVAVDGAT